MDSDVEPQPRPFKPGAIIGGAIMLVVGGTLLLDRSGVFAMPVRRLIGPLVLIAIGSLMVIEKGGVYYGRRQRIEGEPVRPRGGATGGLWLIGIGAWMILAQTHAFGLDFHNSWPLFIILSGLMMLIRGIR
jgi:cell wall-active antibiotic response 4TMS protein YvqF